MKQQSWRPSPAMLISLLALLLALGGTVYAANRINGRTIRARSIPGNRLRLRSVPANRLRPGVLGRQITGPLTGADIDEGSLGTVPSAVHAQSADTARSAIDAETALNAVNAVNAQTVNGHGAGCLPGTQQFAGACWQSAASETALSATAAATSCAVQGGALPEALQLVDFAQQPGVTLESGGEWSSDITNMSATDIYAVVTISASGNVGFAGSEATKKFRCVLPLLR
jgi:hypothetical protein